jgi:hypothetical protein
MNRRIAWTLWLGTASSMALALAGCGDDTTTSSVTDGGGQADATTTDTGSGGDGTVSQDAPGDVTSDVAVDSAGDGGADASDAAGEAESDAGACVSFDAAGLDDASVQAGRLAVWMVYKCQGCHQRASQPVNDAGAGIVLSGNNDGIGDSGMTFPPNLTGDPITGLGCWTDMQIANAILHDQDQDGGSLCASMPKWGTALMTADGGVRPGTPMDGGTAQEIVDFLRSLPPVSNSVPDTTCPVVAHDGGTDAGDAAEDAADGGDADAAPGDAGDSGG